MVEIVIKIDEHLKVMSLLCWEYITYISSVCLCPAGSRSAVNTGCLLFSHMQLQTGSAAYHIGNADSENHLSCFLFYFVNWDLVCKFKNKYTN